MILADKIINERKKNGWSQEDLAEQLSVSRQSVSKWEGAQAVPDLQKIIKMAEIFGVTTDYLLKDELEPDDITAHKTESKDVYEGAIRRKVSMEEANEYMEFQRNSAKPLANATSMCILSPFVLIFMAGLAEKYPDKVSENLAAGVGLLALFILIISAVCIFVKHNSKAERFQYLVKEAIETEYGVTGLVKEKKKDYVHTHEIMMIVGISLCIGCAVPVIAAALAEAEDFILVMMVCVLFVLVSAGVNLLVRTGNIWESYQVLLEENEFSASEKKVSGPVGLVMSIYWTIVTAGYLAWSFLTKRWDYTWIVWAVAGVLAAAVRSIVKMVAARKAE